MKNIKKKYIFNHPAKIFLTLFNTDLKKKGKQNTIIVSKIHLNEISFTFTNIQ